MAKKRRRGDRFPLLIYHPLGQRWNSLGILLFVLSLMLWWTAPKVLHPSVGQTPVRHLAFIPVLVGAFLTVYGFSAKRLASVQCFPTYFCVQGPFYRLVVSYRRVEGTRPVQMNRVFDPEEEKRANRDWPRRYWAMTGVAVDLKGFPLSERWLRLWFDPCLFLPDGTGFIFLVEDWMSFSQQLDGFLSKYQTRRGR